MIATTLETPPLSIASVTVPMITRSVAAIFVIAFVLTAQQPIAPDEIRGGVESYTPPPQSSLTIRTQVNLVEVPVIVRDGDRIVSGLQRSDFQVTESGHPREITSFSVETLNRPSSPSNSPDSVTSANSPAPSRPTQYVGFLFDDLNTPYTDLVRVKSAAIKFLKDSFPSGDRAGIATTAWLKPPVFSSDTADLEKQIQALRSNPRAGSPNDLIGPICPPLNFYETYLLANHLDPQLLQLKIREYIECNQIPLPPPTAEEAVLTIATHYWELQRSNTDNTLHGIRTLVDRMAGLPGRKMIMLTSAGFLTGTLEMDLEDVMRRARQANITINSMEARGLTAYVPGMDVTKAKYGNTPKTAIESQTVNLQTQGRGDMEVADGIAALAIGTGGRMFENNNDLAAGYRKLVVPDVGYTLGISVGDVQDGKYHPIKVHLTNGRHGSIQARPGYLAGLPEKAQQPASSGRPIDREFVEGRTLADFPAEINIAPRSAPSTVTAYAHVDLTRVKFEQRGGRRIQNLTFIAGLMNEEGSFIRGKQAHYDLALTDQSYKKYVEQGFNITVTLDAPPGKYVLRGIVAEGASSRMTAISRAIQVH